MVQEAASTDDELIAETGYEPDVAPEDSTGAFVRSTALMSVGTSLSRLTGLVRVLATLYALGTTVLSDTYLAANTTPNIVYELVLGGILTSVFVPVFVDRAARHGREDSWDVAGRVLTIALVVLSVVAALGAIAAPWIMRAYLVGTSGELKEAQVALGAFFLRWFMPQIVFYGIGAVATGVLQASRRFGTPMFAPILNNLAVTVTMLAFAAVHGTVGPGDLALTWGEKTLLGAGTTLGVVAMTVALWPSLRRLGFRWRLRWDWRHPAVGTLARLARWTVLYVAANQLAYLIVIALNNDVAPGKGITAYSQAFIFFQLPYAIFAVSIFTALLPGMAEGWSDERPDRVRTLFSRGIRDMLVILVPAALGYAALAHPIVELVAGYGSTTASGRDLLADALQAFAVGLPFFAAFQLLTRTFYAMHDARTPALLNVAAALVNVSVDLLLALVLDLGVAGLALGHAISYVAGTAGLLLLLRRRLGRLDGTRILGTVLRVVPVAAVSAGAAWLVTTGLASAVGDGTVFERLVGVLGGVVAGVLVFGVGALILGVREVDEVLGALRGRFARGR